MLEFGSEFNEIIAMDDGVTLKYMFINALGSAAADYDAYGNSRNNMSHIKQ